MSTHSIDVPTLRRLLFDMTGGVLGEAQLNALIEHLRCGIRDIEPEFRTVLERCQPFTMTSDARMHAMFSATRYLARRPVPGAIVECGVWKGGSAMVSMLALQQIGVTDRDFFLYDTFEGLPAPTDEDRDLDGRPAEELWQQYQRDGIDTLAYCSLEATKSNLATTGYPESRIHYIQGLVEETIPERVPESIALLRIDTDWYSSVAHVLNNLYDRVAPGGVVIIDDYGHFQGARKAVDEFLAARKLTVLLNRVDYTGRMFIK